MKIVILFFVVISLVSCEGFREGIISYDTHPKFGIYKTNGDYFHYYNTFYSDGIIPVALHHPCEDSVMFVEGSDTSYYFRIRLDSNYILDEIVGLYDQFTDIKFDEYCEVYNSNHEEGESIKDFIESRIVDDNPFVEYFEVKYSLVGDYHVEFLGDHPFKEAKYLGLKKAAVLINEMIKNGTLEENFKKMK